MAELWAAGEPGRDLGVNGGTSAIALGAMLNYAGCAIELLTGAFS